MAEAPAGNTFRNREGPNILNALEADIICERAHWNFIGTKFLGTTQDDGFTDNRRKVPRRSCQ